MMAVLKWELMRRKWFVVWWTIGISSLIAMTVFAYLSFKDETKQLNDTFKGITDSAGSFFGGTDFFSPIGYLSSQIYYILLPILVIIMTTTLASSLLNRDENDTTVELSLARPIGRAKLLALKALAGLIITTIIGVLTYGVTIGSVVAVDFKIDHDNLLLTHILTFAFSLTFGVISFALMAVSQLTRKVATILAIVLSFGSYIVTSLGGMVDWLETLGKFLPYHYFNTNDLLTGKVDSGLIIYIIGTILIGAIIATVGYSRRDIG